jgi:hypothetical protein
LKRNVASLIEHMKGRATNTVQDTAGQITRRVRSLGQGPERRRSLRQGDHSLPLRTSPVAALTIAITVGYVGPRVLDGERILSASDLVTPAVVSLEVRGQHHRTGQMRLLRKARASSLQRAAGGFSATGSTGPRPSSFAFPTRRPGSNPPPPGPMKKRS